MHSPYIEMILRTATHSSILAWRILWTEEPGEVKKEQEKILKRENHTIRDEEELVAKTMSTSWSPEEKLASQTGHSLAHQCPWGI